MTTYNYTITTLNVDRLTLEIQSSAITIALDHISALGTSVDIVFKADLPNGDKTILDGIAAAHTGAPLAAAPLAVSVSSQPAVTIFSAPPYGSKTIMVNGATKKLYARNTGIQYTLAQGSNTLTYTATYAWAKLLGVECVNCEALDTVDFKVYDTAAGTYSGVPNALLNQFSYSINLPKDFYQKMSQFDADIYAGMIIQMTYVSVSAKTIGMNLLMDEVKS